MNDLAMHTKPASKLVIGAIGALFALVSLHANAARPEDVPKPADAALSAAEAFDVVRAAKAAVADQQLHAQSPTRMGDGYRVVVNVDGKVCTVTIVPKVPVVQRPILQWAAGKPMCTK